METIVKLAALAADWMQATNRIVASRGRLFAASVLAVFAGLLVVGAFGCAAASLWIYADPPLGPAGAGLVVAGVLLVSALVALAVMRYLLRETARSSEADAAARAAVLDKALQLFNDNKGKALVASFLAGLAAGDQKK